jgi:hypothetical protein
MAGWKSLLLWRRKMNPVFIDLHIHTSKNPESLDSHYDVKELKRKIDGFSENSLSLISLTDHNTINTQAYLKADKIFENLLVGAELHIRHHDQSQAYHCHIYFKTQNITESKLDDINAILDELYQKKVVSSDDEIPKLEDITNAFDAFEFLLLPHGGQSHSTFDTATSKDKIFDKTLERNIYYNHFDGFMARSDKKIESIIAYFKRLGIHEFTNLITSSDNYNVNSYPSAKDSKAAQFVPTWMLALPTYDGLRLSLSESTRFEYGKKPDVWNEHIQTVKLKNENIDISVNLTPGLNVVIGGSSSGKTLFVDSIYRAIEKDFSKSDYIKTNFDVTNLEVVNPSNLRPHFISQNFIMKVCDQADEHTSISDIELLKRIFPDDTHQKNDIDKGLGDLGKSLGGLVVAVEGIESLQNKLETILPLSRLIIVRKINANPLLDIVPGSMTLQTFTYSDASYNQDFESLSKIDEFLENNPLVEHNHELIVELKNEINQAKLHSKNEKCIREIIQNEKRNIDKEKTNLDKESAIKSQDMDKLKECIREYSRLNNQFYKSLKEISEFSVVVETQKVVSMGHELSIENKFELSKAKFLDVINGIFKKPDQIARFEEITPESLFKDKYKHKDPVVITYDDFKRVVNSRFSLLNKKKYRIKISSGHDYDTLSAGYKTSVILDIVLGSTDDIAPLIIDQPEDNLATSYINKGLIQAIKDCKSRKQILLVSHNATIPMLGDAQNVVFCENRGKKIIIRSNPLEGSINGRSVVDIVADETDGGKSSIKKRVKKYNLKQFKE